MRIDILGQTIAEKGVFWVAGQVLKRYHRNAWSGGYPDLCSILNYENSQGDQRYRSDGRQNSILSGSIGGSFELSRLGAGPTPDFDRLGNILQFVPTCRRKLNFQLTCYLLCDLSRDTDSADGR
jgi:hypothetical protein